MTTFTQHYPTTLLRTDTLEVKLATSFAEIDAALRLRFEVFNLELQEGLLASYERGYDSDAYDAYCDHLIVKDLLTGKVVGTYRLLRQSVAERQIGFYSENEFDLTPLKRLPGELLELGRSCVAHTHRNATTISKLWHAIIEYARQRGIRYLFGCGSLHQTEVEQVQPLYTYLRDHYCAPEAYRVQPVPSCRLAFDESSPLLYETRAMSRQLSPVMKGYLRAGAMICSPPAFDAEFGTADVLVLLEMEKLTARYQQHYAEQAA
ncbi:MAG: GNAT family N-acyltransferase [Blastocatellia bacterium]